MTKSISGDQKSLGLLPQGQIMQIFRHESAFGRAFTQTRGKVDYAIRKLGEAILKKLGLFFKGLAGLVSNPLYLGRTIRLIIQSLGLYRICGNHPNFLENCDEPARWIDRTIEISYILDDFDYFGNAKFIKDFEEKKLFSFGKRISYLLGDIATPILFLDEIKIINIGKAISNLGKLPICGIVFQTVGRLGLEVVVDGVFTVGRCFSFVDILIKSFSVKGIHRRKEARIHALYIALKVISKVASYLLAPKGLSRIVLKLTASVFGIVSALYSIYKAEKIKVEEGIAEKLIQDKKSA